MITKLNRAIYKISGEDALRYLNGQITNDMNLVTEVESKFAFVTNGKGRITGEMWVHWAGENTYFFDGPLLLREELYTRLSRYLIADDAEIVDVTDEYELFFSEDDSAVDSKVASQALFVWSSQRLGEWAKDFLVKKGQVDLAEADISLDNSGYNDCRIKRGIPHWDGELDQNLLPAETGLLETAVSFTKGCYIGQEVISRMKTAGKVNKKLTQVYFESRPSSVEVLSESGENIGVMTSVGAKSGMVLFKVKKLSEAQSLSTEDGQPIHLAQVSN